MLSLFLLLSSFNVAAVESTFPNPPASTFPRPLSYIRRSRLVQVTFYSSNTIIHHGEYLPSTTLRNLLSSLPEQAQGFYRGFKIRRTKTRLNLNYQLVQLFSPDVLTNSEMPRFLPFDVLTETAEEVIANSLADPRTIFYGPDFEDRDLGQILLNAFDLEKMDTLLMSKQGRKVFQTMIRLAGEKRSSPEPFDTERRPEQEEAVFLLTTFRNTNKDLALSASPESDFIERVMFAAARADLPELVIAAFEAQIDSEGIRSSEGIHHFWYLLAESAKKCVSVHTIQALLTWRPNRSTNTAMSTEEREALRNVIEIDARRLTEDLRELQVLRELKAESNVRLQHGRKLSL